MQVERIPSGISGGRVSNTWVTCLQDRYNAWKRVLIPDSLLVRMDEEGKVLWHHLEMGPRRIS